MNVWSGNSNELRQTGGMRKRGSEEVDWSEREQRKKDEKRKKSTDWCKVQAGGKGFRCVDWSERAVVGSSSECERAVSS